MRRTFAGLAPLLVAVLALMLPGKLVAGPPDDVSGATVFDEVVDGLRRYCKEPNAVKRVTLLKKLACTRDVRLEVLLRAPVASRVSEAGLGAVGHNE
jgi:hypothetical protein